MSDEKTEQPTDHKLEQARKKGQSHQSQEINAAANLVALVICLSVAASMAVEHLTQLINLVFDHGMAAQSVNEVQGLTLEIAKHGFLIAVPFLLVAVAVATVSSFSQVGFELSFDPVAFKFEKVDPIEGFKRVFSVRSLVDFLKMLTKAIILAVVITILIRSLLPLLMWSTMQTTAGLVGLAWSAILKLIIGSALVFVVVGPIDYALQRWLFIRDQRMSKDEVKREYKNLEGDPLIKGMRRQLAQELAQSDPQVRVPTAAVVLTNPTHYAVALRYKPGVTPLPVVVAKGADAMAMVIRRIATDHKVPIVGNPPLARALFKVQLNSAVPEELFEAVATVLKWVSTVDHLNVAMAAGLEGGAPTTEKVQP